MFLVMGSVGVLAITFHLRTTAQFVVNRKLNFGKKLKICQNLIAP